MELFYRHFGEGQPVIILHGIFGVSDNWLTIGKRIAEQFSVYIVDQRNHGQSPHSRTFNYPTLSQDLYDFIRQHQLKNPIIIGHSMGGKVAMHFALEYPEMLDKLVVIDIAPRKYPGRNVHFDMISAMMSVNFDAVHTREEVDELLKASIPNRRVRQFIMKNLQRKTKNMYGWRINLDGISENLESIFDGIRSQEVFDKPTLFVKGGRSDYIIDEDTEPIHRMFPQAEIEVIGHASHWLHADAPDELCAILSRFLEKYCAMNLPETPQE